MMESVKGFEFEGRTTMRFEDSVFISLLMRFEMEPMRLKIKMMLATPTAMPMQVKMERERWWRM